MKYTAIIILCLFLLSGCKTNIVEEAKPEEPINIILLIGDGMGLSQLTSVYYYKNEEPNVSRFKNVGLIKTSSSSHRITDSGASGTAYACGQKSYNGSIGVGNDSLPIPNITEVLALRGYKNGLIATSSITHATPAAFFAHSKLRSKEEYIASQLCNSKIDFFAAGGTQFFNQREDGANYIDSLANYGFSIDTNSLPTTISDYSQKYGFLLAEKAMPPMIHSRGDFLPQATKLGLEYLSKSDSGFFLMVEGSQIDWAGHVNNSEYLLSEMIDFDNAVGEAMDFAEKNGNTLVIVTADHETGGFALSADTSIVNDGNYDVIYPGFAAKTHTASMVPILTFGPGAEGFGGIYENSILFDKIISLVNASH